MSFFIAEEIIVKHWQRAEVKKVHIPTNSPDVWASFQSNALATFAEEIGNSSFRFYRTPSNFKDITERQKVESLVDFEAFLSDYLSNLMVGRPQLYVWNEENSTPEKLPAIPKFNNEETSSIVSRNSTQSQKCKVRDNNTCVFCGYKDGSARQAGHILDIKYFNHLSIEDRESVLEICHLEQVNALANLISLCSNCHSKFDSFNININPDSYAIEISEKIMTLVTQGSVPFKTLNGKNITFNGISTKRPSGDLLCYRYTTIRDWHRKNRSENVSNGKFGVNELAEFLEEDN